MSLQSLARVGKGPINIASSSIIGRNVTLYDFVLIHDEAEIGDNVTIGYYEGKEHPSCELTIIGKGAKVRSGSVIYHSCLISNKVQIGHNCVIRERTTIGVGSYVGALVMIEGDAVIGRNCGINAQSHITKFCRIGNYVFFGPGVMTSNDNAMAHKRIGHGQNLVGPTIENYVRIAGGTYILPGVKIGEGAIIGAKSLVTKDVVPFSLNYGSPSRLIRPDEGDVIVDS